MKKLITILLMVPMVVTAQDTPFECDNNYGECGTPEMSGGGSQAGGGSVLINNSDLGDTYQSADDYDDDGVEDSYDNCPRVRNSEQFDSDGDGIGDLCDNCRDTHNQNQWDLDGDAQGDLCDTDIDNDGIHNDIDNCLRVFNSTQDDADDDGDGDACDYDIDGDGILNEYDECPTKPNEEGQFYTDAVCFPDADGDGVSDVGRDSDNCPGVYNPDQKDLDNNGVGDMCDPDKDLDGIMNARDNCPEVFNVQQTDSDRDGKGDDCDDEFCYVVFGDTENCLDPASIPQIYSPNVTVNTGDTVRLRLFSNRPEWSGKYTWTVRDRMSGSRDTVRKSIGVTEGASVFEHIVSVHPTFSPKIPGQYVLSVSVEFENGENVSRDVTVLVGGSAISDETGCSISPGGQEKVPALAIMSLLRIARVRMKSSRRGLYIYICEV